MNWMKGQAFLALIFFIGSIIVLAGITLAFFTNSFVDIGYGYQASVQADALAASGAEDALLHLDRGDLVFPASYNLMVGSSTAAVTVTKDVPSAGYYTILSTATVSNRMRKVNVVAAVNAITSQVSVISWQNI